MLLTGTYNSKNKGDSAMQIATAAAVSRRWEAAVTISTPREDLDAPAYAPIPVVHCNRRSVIGMARTLSWAAAARLGLTRFGFVERALGTDESRATVAADLVIDLSGDMLTEDYGVLVGASHFQPLVMAWAARTPYVVLAQSIGPFSKLRPLAKYLLDHAELVTARENVTHELLSSYGMTSPIVTADMAFLLEPDPTGLPAVPPKSADLRLGLSLSGLVAGKYRDASGRELLDDVGAALSPLLDTGAELIVVSHVTGPTQDKDDRVLAREFAERLDGRSVVVDEDLSPGQIKAVIGTCDVFLGARMHANIAALSQAIPTIAMAYSHKYEGIMSLFGQQDAVLDVNQMTIGDLVSTIQRIVDQRHTRSETIARALVDVKAAAESNLDLVEAEIDLT